MSLPIKLPPSLDLPPHLSAHKYFLVCTLTVAAWDTLVLSPRTWRLLRTREWPILKILFHFMRVFMPIEFTVVAVAFFDTKWSQSTCQNFFLFEPICTAILLAAASAVHVIRIHAIYEKSRGVLYLMSALFGLQVVVTAVCCGFYRSVPLDVGQGCIAGPKHNWVGIYWVAPTLLYTTSFVLALKRSIGSLQVKHLTPWKLMLRDGLNLYGAIFLVNAVNMFFWFIMKPSDIHDPIKTIVTSMAAVLTTSMTLRIILSVRGSLVQGGSFALSNSTAHGSTTQSTSTRGTNNNIRSVPNNTTFTIDQIRRSNSGKDSASVVGGPVGGLPGAKGAEEWGAIDIKKDPSVVGIDVGPPQLHLQHQQLQQQQQQELQQQQYLQQQQALQRQQDLGVKITVDREVDFTPFPPSK